SSSSFYASSSPCSSWQDSGPSPRTSPSAASRLHTLGPLDVIHPPRHHPRERALLSGENVIPTFVAPAEAGIETQASMAPCVLAYRGRGAVSLLPALRTVRAVLPHTALRSVVIYIEIGVQERELARG